MPITLDGTNGITTPTYGGADTSEYLVPVTQFKNRIINGAMVIDQRNAGASVTPTDAYTLDRWEAREDTDGAITVQQVSDAPTGFINSLKVTTTTADGSLSATQRVHIGQFIEGLNCSDLAFGSASASLVTLSFRVKSSLTGTFGGVLANSARNRSYPFTYTINSANTWETKSVTIAGDTTGTWLTTNGVGLRVYFGLGVGSTYSGTAGSWQASELYSATGSTSVIGTLNATWQITGVQLEVGSTATSFDYRPYGTELALCQRYYQRILNGHSGAASSTSVETYLNLPITMRGSPSVSVPDGALSVEDHAVTVYTQSSASVTIQTARPEGGKIIIGNFTGLTSSRYYSIAGAFNNRAIHFSAEL